MEFQNYYDANKATAMLDTTATNKYSDINDRKLLAKLKDYQNKYINTAQVEK
jgi:hypothetical protein